MTVVNADNYHRLVSIITPAYNAGRFVGAAIESVLRQTHPLWEMLVVDDCSGDNTGEIVRNYQRQDERIKLVTLPHNAGVANARNAGLQLARGRYVAFLDADDIWLDDKLEIQLNFMQERDAAFTFGQYRHFADNIAQCGKLVAAPACVTYHDLLKYNCIGCLTVMLDREKVSAIAMPAQRHEDYIAWLAITRRHIKAYGIQRDLARYRVAAASLSGNKLRSAGWHWQVLRQTENLPLPAACYYFVWYVMRSLRKHYC